MNNTLVGKRDDFLENNEFNLNQEGKKSISVIINNLITVPLLLEKLIKDGKVNDLDFSVDKIKIGYEIIDEIISNRELVEKLIKLDSVRKNGVPVKNEEYINLYTELMKQK